jgi:hypothetical protein
MGDEQPKVKRLKFNEIPKLAQETIILRNTITLSGVGVKSASDRTKINISDITEKHRKSLSISHRLPEMM